MGGGLLNLVAYGNKNIILNGNPSKTFFKTTYAKYRNFGMQKFRIEFDGQKTLRENTDSHYEFVVPRYADLLMDTYFVITMPNIWSPIYVPTIVSQAYPSVLINPDCCNNIVTPCPPCLTECDLINNKYGRFCQPYEFKWIENLGAQMIRRVRYTLGGQVIQEFTGQYLYNMVQRDFSKAKKDLFNEMIGNVPEMNDPANYSNNNGNYPNYFAGTSFNNEPSIRGRKLYIPLNIWSTLSSKMAFPLVALNKNQLRIEIDCRPIRELFVIRDINSYLSQRWDVSAGVADAGIVPNLDVSYEVPPYISTMNIVDAKYQLYLYLTQRQTVLATYTSPGVKLDPTRQHNWYADPHLLSTYTFLDKEEVQQFRSGPQTYLVKEVNETTLQIPAHRNEKIQFDTKGLVASWMWFFQREDINLRNGWSNYTNWKYDTLPYSCKSLLDVSSNPITPEYPTPCPPVCSTCNGLGTTFPPYAPQSLVFDPSYSNPYITGPYHIENEKYIMKTWSLLCDGKLRENTLNADVLNLTEKYIRTTGNGQSGLYCYNFCLNTDPFYHQPTGAMNLTNFKHIEFECNIFRPIKDISAYTYTICQYNESNNFLVGINNSNSKIHKYDYILHIMEERYNLLTINNDLIEFMFLKT
jgi:hypothetical protein